MRNAAMVFGLLLLLTPSVHAADVVSIPRARITFLSETAAALACKAPGRRGCTTLMTEFVCGCNKVAADKWTLAPKLTATPYIYTTTQEVIRHELEHIADVRASLNEYAAGLLLRTFESEAACTSFVSEEKKLFGSTLRTIKHATTIRRDGVNVAVREGSEH
jgi:hypothetical protein